VLPQRVMPKENYLILVSEGETCLLDPNDRWVGRNDVVLWVLLTIFIAFVIVISVLYSFVAVNSTRNLGPTLISPYTFYPGQYMQNGPWIFSLNMDGVLTLTNEETQETSWQSTNENNYAPYFPYCEFTNNGELMIINYYGQVLFSLVPTVNVVDSYVLNLTPRGQILIRGSDGNVVSCIPEVNCAGNPTSYI
jgi:hypothetical protein